ncbi:hypothetical protein GCM10009720_22070 [Yaniella flava]|uniref:Cell division protein CrgA n=1 Tax=Yaniella flava TaxID=287930 RepID=A0ABP5G9V6_9MICC|nr:cell division protein CrgA [Micrococcaceae bacterium]
MASSKKRGKADSQETELDAQLLAADDQPQPLPTWYKAVMFGLLIVGLLWIMVFYLAPGGQYPIPGIGGWNIIVGFGLAMVGFIMMTRWR